MGKRIVRKVHFNKRTGQPSVPLSKKQIKAIDPSIKFSDDMFVRLEIIRRRK